VIRRFTSGYRGWLRPEKNPSIVRSPTRLLIASRRRIDSSRHYISSIQEAAMSDKDRKNMKVLIADDSTNMLRTLANMLRSIGFENIVRADDGDTALIKLRSEKIDLLLTDWNMPRITGIELLRAIRDDDTMKHLPVLMITGEVDKQTVAEAGEVNVDGYLLKPFTLEDLKTKISEILEKQHKVAPADLHVYSAMIHLKARQTESALEEIRKAMKINPRSPRVLYTLGLILESQGDLENARKAFDRSVEFGHYFLKGHEALARVLKNLGEVEAAADHMKRAVSISPKNVERQLDYGNLLAKTGHKEEMQKVMKNVLKLADANRIDIILRVGETYLETGLAEEAQGLFSEVLKSDPNAIHVYNKMGIALRRQKKFNEAVENYLLALQMDPENENLYYNLGRAYYEAGDKEKAISAMNRALGIYPDFEEAKKFLAIVVP
jgi:tetratricopeptide (TPR) repeat protein